MLTTSSVSTLAAVLYAYTNLASNLLWARCLAQGCSKGQQRVTASAIPHKKEQAAPRYMPLLLDCRKAKSIYVERQAQWCEPLQKAHCAVDQTQIPTPAAPRLLVCCMTYFCCSSYFLRSTFLYSAWLLQSCNQ